MNILPTGEVEYSSVNELIYAMCQEMNITILPDGCLFDTDTGADISFQNKLLKININIQDSRYAGEGEIILDIMNNIKQVSTLLGYYFEKLSNTENKNIIGYYPTEFDINESDYKKTNITIKYEDPTIPTISTNMYYNKCLSLIESIFIVNDDRVNLTNLDSIEYLMPKK